MVLICKQPFLCVLDSVMPPLCDVYQIHVCFLYVLYKQPVYSKFYSQTEKGKLRRTQLICKNYVKDVKPANTYCEI